MKKLSLVLALILCLAVLTACGHEHTPSPEATCTTDQICTECEEILVAAKGHISVGGATCTEAETCSRCGTELAPALGHTPGAEATCTEAQTCNTCGEELAPKLGHSLLANNVCSGCNVQVVPEGQTYIKPGKNGALSDDLSAIIPETEGGHYNNNIDAYYSGAVLVCGDYAVEYFLPSEGGNGAWADTVNAFANKYPNINTTAILVPKCSTFNSPVGYTDPYDKTKAHIEATYAMLGSGIKTADAFGVMAEHRDEYMFYRTDHHWTSLGAYYASVAFCSANGIEPYALDSYETVTKTNFLGTLSMYAGYPDCLEANLDYTVGRYPHVGYSMICGNSGAWYNGKAINSNSKQYAGMFISGDNPLTVITTENKNGKTLMIFKESYGNAFVPYMIDYFEQIVVVDIREESKSVAALIEEYGVTDAIIINNLQAAISLQPQLHAKALS